MAGGLTDDDSPDDAALVNALDVVVAPAERVGDGRVDSHGGEEGARVVDGEVCRAEEHCEAHAAERGDGHVAEAAFACAVCQPPCGYCEQGGRGVGRDGEELHCCARVAETWA